MRRDSLFKQCPWGLWAGMRLPTGWSVRGSNPGGGRDFPRSSRPALWPTQPPIQWVPGVFPENKAAGAWR
jgi:hypothetical protein